MSHQKHLSIFCFTGLLFFTACQNPVMLRRAKILHEGQREVIINGAINTLITPEVNVGSVSTRLPIPYPWLTASYRQNINRFTDFQLRIDQKFYPEIGFGFALIAPNEKHDYALTFHTALRGMYFSYKIFDMLPTDYFDIKFNLWNVQLPQMLLLDIPLGDDHAFTLGGGLGLGYGHSGLTATRWAGATAVGWQLLPRVSAALSFHWKLFVLQPELAYEHVFLRGTGSAHLLEDNHDFGTRFFTSSTISFNLGLGYRGR
jgi:hypothetical protein